MFRVVLFISLHLCFHRGSAVSISAPSENQRWCLGCYTVDSTDPVWRCRGLDPVICCGHCRDTGPATSLPSLCNVSTDRVHAGKMFVLEVCRDQAGRPGSLSVFRTFAHGEADLTTCLPNSTCLNSSVVIVSLAVWDSDAGENNLTAGREFTLDVWLFANTQNFHILLYITANQSGASAHEQGSQADDSGYLPCNGVYCQNINTSDNEPVGVDSAHNDAPNNCIIVNISAVNTPHQQHNGIYCLRDNPSQFLPTGLNLLYIPSNCPSCPLRLHGRLALRGNSHLAESSPDLSAVLPITLLVYERIQTQAWSWNRSEPTQAQFSLDLIIDGVSEANLTVALPLAAVYSNPNDSPFNASIVIHDPAGCLSITVASLKANDIRVQERGRQKVMPTVQPLTTPEHNIVRIHAERQVYATNTNISFLASTDFTDPKEFLWYFGDSRSTRSGSGAMSVKYQTPGRYGVFVVMSVGWTSFTSAVFPMVVQTPVRLNRLVHRAAVLQNQTMTVGCRVNSGTDPVYIWRFGDGTVKSGGNTEQHVFHKVGEFTIEVNVSNLVSSASLRSQIFVVDQPCQPPSVKNMGPLKIQVRRFEVSRLGVTYDADVDCDQTKGLSYSWQLFDSAGRLVPLTNTHQQSLTLPSYLLQYDTYTAVARVEVMGSVVYSNYSVKLEVVPSTPVASIQGPTNLLVNKWKSDVVVLDGRESHDPDNPRIPVSFTWTCEPVSSIKTSCFNQHVNMASSRLRFPVNTLKSHFDQFHVTLTVHSGERWASSEVFVTLTSHVIRAVTIHCPRCHGDQVNWDQPFTVISGCVDCDVSSENIQYTWDLYTVNASTKPVFEVPFCNLAQLGAPSHLMEGSTTTTVLMPGSPPAPTADSSPHAGYRGFAYPLEEFNTETRTVHEDDRLSEKSDVVGDFDGESSADWNFDYAAAQESVDFGEDQDYRVSSQVTEEGDPGKSPGRPMGVDGEIFVPGDELEFTPVSHDSEGSNLMDSSRAVVIREPTLLDLPRVPVHKRLFDSFTHTGASSSVLSLRAFSLKPSSRYMLQVTATSRGGFLGRAQMFVRTKPAPKGMTCQVQPTIGIELHTQFSIFCTSGRADLVYEYSYSVGARPARIMYQGTDFQYYFNLPSGDPSNDYQVTIYTTIRSSLLGTSTMVCPVSVQVQPSYVREISSPDPESELSKLGIEHLTALVKLGNKAEIRNYISLLSNILERQNISTRIRLHSVLVCTVCQLEADGQASMLDNISVLKDLLHVSGQVTMWSVKRVTAHIQTVSTQLSDTTGPALYNLDQQMLTNLLDLLSYSLQAAKAHYIPQSAGLTQDIILETFMLQQRATASLHDCTRFPPNVSIKTKRRIVRDILQLASELIVEYISLLKAREHRFITGGMFFHATHMNQSLPTLSSSSCTLHTPTSLTRLLPGSEECVVGLLTELTHSPYTWAKHPPEVIGPVIDLSLYKCRTRRKISVQALFEPIIIEVQRPKRNQETSTYELLRGCINYHRFNITQKQLQRSIQLRLRFSPATDKPFPVMLLFRMNERPTPGVFHLQRFYQWKSLSTYITFPPSYLNAAGFGYLALLNANFEQPLRNHHLSRRISYSLEVVSAQCLSWNEPQGLWTPHGCRTHQTEADAAVICSCHQLRPLTVAREQIESFHETAELDPFVSMSSDLTIVGVLLVIVCLFVPLLVACKRADLISKDDQRVHYLADNSSWDSHLYAVTIHTGLCSAARMSAKAYIVLYGEEGVSQTRELRVPGCTLFRRNSQNTFLLSASGYLGPVHGVHIWHDNSGHSPYWYIKLVEVAEVNRFSAKQQTWWFVGQCWLAVNKGDGRVERTLRRTCGVRFAQRLHLKLSDYLSDYHIWMSVYSCPRPSSFTHTGRLGLCLLLLLGYAGVNTLMISQMNELLLFDLGFVGASSVAARTGFSSVMTVLPVATLVHIFFRRCTVKNKHNSQDNSVSTGQTQDPHHAWLNLQQQDADVSVSVEGTVRDDRENETMEKKDSPIQIDQTSVSGSIVFQKTHLINNTGGIAYACKKIDQHDNISDPDIISGFPATKDFEGKKMDSSHYFAWTLCLLLSLLCLVLSAVLGLSFNDSKVLLWIHSLFFSLLFCVFFVQPVLILAVAMVVCFTNKHKVSAITERETPITVFHPTPLEDGSLTFEKLLGARRRARYLQLVRPPSQTDLRKVRAMKTRETRIGNTLRELCVCVAMFTVVMNSSSSSFSDQHHLNKVIRQQFTWEKDDSCIQTEADWWEWTQNQLLDIMYNSATNEASHHILIGEPLLWKMEISRSFQCQFWRLTLGAQDHKGCDQSATVHLGQTRTEASHKLKVLKSSSWLGKGTLAVKVQFSLFSPAPNLFTTVTFVAERRLTGVLLPPAKVQSVQLHRSPALHDYGVMLCQLLFVVLSLLHLWLQIHAVGQQGLIRYCRSPCKWLELILLPITLLYIVQHIDHSSLLVGVVDLLQRHNYRGHVDVSQLATREQEIQSLRGVLLLLLVVKCVTVVKVNKTAAPRVNVTCSRLLLSVISSFILSVAVGVIRSLLSPDQNLWISGFKFLRCRALSLSSAVLLSTLIMSVSSIKKAKPSQSRTEVCTIAEILDYIRRKACECSGRPPQTDVDMKTYYLEEFDCLLDELLYTLDSYTLPAPSLTPEPVGVDSQKWTDTTIMSDHRGHDAQQLGFNKMASDGEDDALNMGTHLKGQTSLVQQEDGGSPQSSEPTGHWSERSQNLFRESPTCREDELQITQSIGNVFVEVLVHQEPQRV